MFTPARFSALPERPFPGDPDGYPARRDVSRYLRDYAADFGFPVRCDTRVVRVTSGGAGLSVETTTDVIPARAVVAATGAFQRPRVPAFACDLAPHVHQLHSSAYRNPGALPGRSVLVVGAGNSGLQIAAELAAASKEVHLAVGSSQLPLPRRILGRDIFWWLDRIGFTRAPVDRLPTWLAGDGDILIGHTVGRTLRRGGMSRHPRVTGVDDGGVVFADGSRTDVDVVLWATGYRPDYSWLPADAVEPDGRPIHRRGSSPVAGVYFVGLENQYSTASSLIGWVQRDARTIAEHAAAYVRR
ncbi:MAG: NAD(P)/FAD-dependent oxidoreductase [Actinomycetota bacterium]|nr:NAD(P)/FAD-dependent oxidoreductase [Actinomycetota bacterium]